MGAVDTVIVGCGQRGRHVFGAWARRHPGRLRVVAIAEPLADRRQAMAREHDLDPDACFEDWQALLHGPRRAAAAIIATGDTLHAAPAQAALERGYDVLLEKPIATTPEDCVQVIQTAARCEGLLEIAHVLRYTPFYARVHQVVRSGRLGRLVRIDLREHIAHWHMTHSYVRGKFRKREIAAPIVLAKSCHDLDLLCWLGDAPARRVTSFGSLSHYRQDRAPEGAPERCTQGCPVQPDCIHDAVHFYLDPDERLARLWPWSDVSSDPTAEARRRALESGPYGRCVYRCDNDVPDHQEVTIELESGACASFALHGHATHETRTIRISGTRGELRGRLQGGVIEVSRHGSLEVEEIRLEDGGIGHFGGDEGLLDHFTDIVARGAWDEARTSGRTSLESHLIGFAAERARLEGRVVEMAELRADPPATSYEKEMQR
ncbi:MAG: Gfo/Idh/MocA family protein [Myxococcota bacterium]